MDDSNQPEQPKERKKPGPKYQGPEKLTQEQLDLAFEMIMNGAFLEKIAKALGFNNRTSMLRHQARDPEFANVFDRARLGHCFILEEEMLAAADEYSDAHSAKVKVDAIARILKYRNPNVYGDRIELQVKPVDISSALDRAERRVLETRAVIQMAIEAKRQKEDNDT